MSFDDPLYRLRHAIAGVLIALLLALPVAAMAGSWIGDLMGGGYGLRAGLYGGLLLYVVAGAAVLFTKVAQHETQPLAARRVLLWFASLWLWPALLLPRRRA